MHITVRKAFEKVVLKYPNKTALCFEDGKKRFSYTIIPSKKKRDEFLKRYADPNQ